MASQTGREDGIEIVEVIENSPAATAGLRAADLIIAVDGDPISDVGDLQRLMVAERIGNALEVEVVRDGAALSLKLVPRELET